MPVYKNITFIYWLCYKPEYVKKGLPKRDFFPKPPTHVREPYFFKRQKHEEQDK